LLTRFCDSQNQLLLRRGNLDRQSFARPGAAFGSVPLSCEPSATTPAGESRCGVDPIGAGISAAPHEQVNAVCPDAILLVSINPFTYFRFRFSRNDLAAYVTTHQKDSLEVSCPVAYKVQDEDLDDVD
jgi:hypothetical protein